VRALPHAVCAHDRGRTLMPRPASRPVRADRATMGTEALGEALPTVLLVERNASLRRLLDELLTEAGYRVLEAGSRPAVIGYLREAVRLDVVVTDTGLALPGWEVVQEASGLRPGVPVVRLIESAADALPIYGEDPSTMILIQKPFAITELLDVLDLLVPRSHPRPVRVRRWRGAQSDS
jgi:DNA-binding response OmpR family regulator